MARKKLNKEEAKEVIEKLGEMFPDAKCELNYTRELDLLIATMLSAQCTDVRVNKVTEDLFKELKTAKDYIDLGQEALGERIKSCGFYNNKSKNIIAACEVIEEKYKGELPRTIEQLMELPGVGRKTANVVGSNLFNIPAIAVDTHVFRVSNRLGLANAKNVEDTEKQLMKAIAKEKWTISHHRLIFLGRRLCKARGPLCDECDLADLCLFYRNRGNVNEK